MKPVEKVTIFEYCILLNASTMLFHLTSDKPAITFGSFIDYHFTTSLT